MHKAGKHTLVAVIKEETVVYNTNIHLARFGYVVGHVCSREYREIGVHIHRRGTINPIPSSKALQGTNREMLQSVL